MGNLFSVPGDEQARRYRAKANEYAEARGECYKKSKDAYLSKDHDKAKSLSQKGKKYQEQMEEANKKAADAIFNHNNSNGKVPEDTIDLHGLFVQEAIERLETRIESVKKRGDSKLIVIVGQGNHSSDKAKIKPAVQKYAVDKGIHYKLNDPNAGCILFQFAGESRSTCIIM